MFSGSPEPGDWVRLTRMVPVTLADHIGGDGLRRGSRALVIARYGGRVELDVDAGWGSCRTTVSLGDCALVRKGGGAKAFRSRTRTITIVRVSLALFLSWPILYFVGVYLWTYRSLDGIVAAFMMNVVDGIPDQIDAALHEPVKAVAAAVLFAVIMRVALGPRR
jgi:hypothetical protein